MRQLIIILRNLRKLIFFFVFLVHYLHFQRTITYEWFPFRVFMYIVHKHPLNLFLFGAWMIVFSTLAWAFLINEQMHKKCVFEQEFSAIENCFRTNNRPKTKQQSIHSKYMVVLRVFPGSNKNVDLNWFDFFSIRALRMANSYFMQLNGNFRMFVSMYEQKM